jgi:DNA-binding NarL/FixJ family response regulator
MTSRDVSSSPPDPPINVWIVEDDPHFRAAIRKLLINTVGIGDPTTFETCEAALSACEEDDAPEAVLMDIELPGMSGVEGVRRLTALAPTAYVVMLTVHEDNDKIFEAICAGASGYLLKPSSGEQIVEAVRAVRTGGAAINPQIASKVLGMFAEMAVPKGDYNLSAREREVLEELAEGKTTQRIADDLNLSYYTVDMHIRNIYAKLQVHSRSGAVAKALKERLI